MTKALASVTVIRGNGECRAIVNGLVEKELERQAAIRKENDRLTEERIKQIERQLVLSRIQTAQAFDLYKREHSENGKNAHARLLQLKRKERRSKAIHKINVALGIGVDAIAWVLEKVFVFVGTPFAAMVEGAIAFKEFHKKGDEAWAVAEGLERH